MWQAEYKLYLYPDDQNSQDQRASYSSQAIEKSLKIAEFIGEEIINDMALTASTQKRFATGEKFLSRISFMGCSPHIELEPQADSAYCYIEIPNDQDENNENNKNKAVFIAGKNLRKYACPHCDHAINYQNINWRKTGFIARNWVVSTLSMNLRQCRMKAYSAN